MLLAKFYCKVSKGSWRGIWCGYWIDRRWFCYYCHYLLYFWGRMVVGKSKTGNMLTDLCLDDFRFLSLTMKVNLSSYTVFTIEHMDINSIVIFQYPQTKIIVILWVNFYLCFNLFKPVYFLNQFNFIKWEGAIWEQQ